MSKTIDITPTWPTVMRVYLAVIEQGTETGKQSAREALMQMAENFQKVADMLTVTVVEKEVYGKTLTYPVGEPATLLAALLNVKTFNPEQLNGIRNLGYTVKTIPYTVKS